MTKRSTTYLCWYDPDRQRTVEQKIVALAQHYADERGAAPTTCLLNPSDLDQFGRDRATVECFVVVDGGPRRCCIAVEEAAFLSRHSYYLAHEAERGVPI